MYASQLRAHPVAANGVQRRARRARVLAAVMLASCGRSQLDDGTPSTNSADSGTGLVILAEGEEAPGSITVDGSDVYWANGDSFGSVVKCAVTGCGKQPTVLADHQGFPRGVVRNADALYWSDNGSGGYVKRCQTAGCNGAPDVIAANLDAPTNVSIDATSIYWASFDEAVVSCGIGGCTAPSTIFFSAKSDMWSTAVAPGRLFWAACITDVDCNTGGLVMACDPSNCQVSAMTFAAAQRGPLVIVTNGTNVVWADDAGGISTCPVSGCVGAPTVLASGPYDRYAGVTLTVDDTSVYWTTAIDGMIRKCSLSGCNGVPTVLAKNQGTMGGIAVDATSVYWTSYADGFVVKLTPK